MRIVVLIGFDRAGGSFVAGMLARHPDVRYYCQPDNSSPLHWAQWQRWGPGDGDPASVRFLAELVRGRLDPSYVVSDWFHRAGCARYDLDPARVNLIKSTKLHAKVPWLRQHPTLEVKALMRDPRCVVASLVRNGFHRRWYGPSDYHAACALASTLPSHVRVLDLHPPGKRPTAIERMAYLVLVRTAILCADLGWSQDHLMAYEHVLRCPSRYLCQQLALPRQDLESAHAADFNLIGHRFCGAYHGWHSLPCSEQQAIAEILDPLAVQLGYPAALSSDDGSAEARVAESAS